MEKTNFKKVKNMISYKCKHVNMWPKTVFSSLVNEGKGRRLDSNEKWRSQASTTI